MFPNIHWEKNWIIRKTCKIYPNLTLLDTLEFISETVSKNRMTRSRYWKITSDEMSGFTYDESKLLNWEIKCVREPEDEAHFIGVFMYRHGTAYDYEAVKGICYFHNNIDRKELPAITDFLQKKYGGKEMEKGERIFLKDSKEIYSGNDIGNLAKEMESKFNTKAIISLEFDDLTQEQLKEYGLPEAKLLPIPGK